MPRRRSNHSSDEPSHQLEVLCAGDHPAQPVEWLWPQKIPLGKVTLLIGDPGTGKSLLALDIAARASRLAPWPDANVNSPTPVETPSDHSPSDIRHSSFFPPFPASTIILSATDNLADTIRPRLDAAGADPQRIFVIPSLADLRQDFEQLRAAADSARSCRLIIIDPINAYVGPGDSHFQTVVRKVLEPLAKFAAKRGIAVLAIAHLRKSDGAAIYRAAGSMGFVAAARAVWTITRDNTNPSRYLFLPLKQNLTAAARGLAFTFQSAPNGAPTLAWDPTPITAAADEILRSPGGVELNTARQWLQEQLAGGPRSASQLTEEAAHHGFLPRTLRRALHAIGGQTQNLGIIDGWWWSIPKAEGEPAKAEGEQGIPNDQPSDHSSFDHSPSDYSSSNIRHSSIPPSDHSSFDIRHSSFPPNDHSPSDIHPSSSPNVPPPHTPPSPVPLPPSTNPVPSCPLSENSNDPPPTAWPPSPPNLSESIAFLDRRRQRTGRFSDQFREAPSMRSRASAPKDKSCPTTTGHPALDESLELLRRTLSSNASTKRPQPPSPDSS